MPGIGLGFAAACRVGRYILAAVRDARAGVGETRCGEQFLGVGSCCIKA
jgi:hypothetical protein